MAYFCRDFTEGDFNLELWASFFLFELLLKETLQLLSMFDMCQVLESIDSFVICLE